jgi:DNA invertase Pin-like site-specific DNA recombinase
MAAMAEHEAAAISQRTKVALAAAKVRGTRLGGRRHSIERWREIGTGSIAAARKVHSDKAAQARAEVLPIIAQLKASGATSLRAVAASLNAKAVPAPRGGEWSAVQVKRVLDQAAGTEAA